MLSRTADHLFWMSRYTERAENTSRMLDVNYETSLLPQSAAAAQVGWQGLLSISELLPSYTEKHGEVTPRSVMEFMVRDEDNPSSIISCLRAARENARAVRGTLTTEVWETQNQTWLEVNRMLRSGEFEADPGKFFEWVKFRSHLSRGVTRGHHADGRGAVLHAPGHLPGACRQHRAAGRCEVPRRRERLSGRRRRARPGVRLLPLERDPAQRQSASRSTARSTAT